MLLESRLLFCFPPHHTISFRSLFALRQHLRVFISTKTLLEKTLYSSVLYLLYKPTLMAVHRMCTESRVWLRTTPCAAGVPGVTHMPVHPSAACDWTARRIWALSGSIYFIQGCTGSKIIAKVILGIASPGNRDLFLKNVQGMYCFLKLCCCKISSQSLLKWDLI